jgi:hypothetical protein
MDARRIFSTLEATMEHAQSAFLQCGKQAGHTPHEHRAGEYGMATPEYHLLAVEEGCASLYQRLVKALPGAAALDEGEVTASIVAAIDAEQWNVGEPMGPAGPFFSVVSSTGRVIALQVPSRELAERIATLPQLEARVTQETP